MQYLAIHYAYVDDAELITRHRSDRRAFLSGLTDKGLIASGTYPDVTPPSALLVFKAESTEAVFELPTGDPLWSNDVLADVRIVHWTPVIGIFTEQLEQFPPSDPGQAWFGRRATLAPEGQPPEHFVAIPGFAHTRDDLHQGMGHYPDKPGWHSSP